MTFTEELVILRIWLVEGVELMGYVTTWIGNTEVEVLDSEVLDCMEFFCCSYDDALFVAGCQALGLSAHQIAALTVK